MTAPTAALEVLLDLPPLHIFIQGEARSVVHRLMQGPTPISLQHGTEHQRLHLEMKADPILGMPTDTMVPRYNFNKNFQTVIPDREDWKDSPPISSQSIWYTDGSKTEQGAGAGIHGTRPKVNIPLSLGKHATVFQAETTAIHCCAREIIRQGTVNQSIAIFSDSQAAIKAISSTQINSRLVWDCLMALTELGNQNRVTLAWVPGHKGHKGNEKADELAREGASKALIGPEPFCGVAKPCIRAAINEWVQNKSLEWWRNLPGQRQAKEFIKGRSAKFTEDLLSLNRKAIRIIVGLLTGHCRLNRHMSLMGLAEDAICRFCQEEEETAAHVLCHCEGLVRLRFQLLGEEKPRAESYTKGPLSRLWSLIQRTKLNEVL